jgi:hypothetical protein
MSTDRRLKISQRLTGGYCNANTLARNASKLSWQRSEGSVDEHWCILGWVSLWICWCWHNHRNRQAAEHTSAIGSMRLMGYEIKSGFGIVLRLWVFGYHAIPAAKLDPIN